MNPVNPYSIVGINSNKGTAAKGSSSKSGKKQSNTNSSSRKIKNENDFNDIDDDMDLDMQTKDVFDASVHFKKQALKYKVEKPGSGENSQSISNGPSDDEKDEDGGERDGNNLMVIASNGVLNEEIIQQYRNSLVESELEKNVASH